MIPRTLSVRALQAAWSLDSTFSLNSGSVLELLTLNHHQGLSPSADPIVIPSNSSTECPEYSALIWAIFEAASVTVELISPLAKYGSKREVNSDSGLS